MSEEVTNAQIVPSDTGAAKNDDDPGNLRLTNIKCYGVTACAKMDCSSRYMEPQDGFVKSESRCKFAKCTVISSQEIYNDDDIRSVYTNKAPFNQNLCQAMVLFTVGGIALAFLVKSCPGGASTCADDEKVASYMIPGLVVLLIGLIAGFFFWLQCCRPTLKVNVYTTRLGLIPLSWGVMQEELKVRGHGPGLKVHDADDVGHKLLNRSQAEQVLSEHAGKDIPKQGIQQSLIITNRRVGFKRRKACCCKFVTLENSLHTYKLDEVQNAHADSSCPLFFIIWCVWFLITLLTFYLWTGSKHPCRDDTGTDKPDWCEKQTTAVSADARSPDAQMILLVFGGICVLYGMLVPQLPGGIGFCRKSRIMLYFKSPTPTWFPLPAFVTGWDEMELPPLVGPEKAVEMCSEVMKAKADFMREKLAKTV